MSKDDVRPPRDPWVPLEVADEGSALAIYLSDPNTNIPIRDVSNKNDPKGDPNIETLTFGLFTKCHEQMRKSMVVNGIEYLLFCTQRREKYFEGTRERSRARRVLTGYYRIGWHYEVEKNDFMLAAKSGKFIFPGFPLDSLSTYLYGDDLDTGFLQVKLLEGRTTELLLNLIDDTLDATEMYLSEITRLEKEALANYGFMYRTRKDSLTWLDASKPMKL